MKGFRKHLLAITLATVSVHLGTLTAGSLRVCWGSEHRHAGVAEPNCAMHHHSPALSQEHGHHGRDSAHPPNDRQQIACNCANDAGSLYFTPNATVAALTSITPPTEVHVVTPEPAPSVTPLESTPLSPPPRSALSSRSLA